MKKILIISICTVFVLSISVFATSLAGYDKVKNELKPNSNDKKLDVLYKANKNVKVKTIEQLNGFVPDAELEKNGGKYTLKKTMTYKECFDSGLTESFRHDIDPERLVWVLTSKFNKTHVIDGKPVEKAIVTTVYDAETGDFLDMSVKSDDPHGLDALISERPLTIK